MIKQKFCTRCHEFYDIKISYFKARIYLSANYLKRSIGNGERKPDTIHFYHRSSFSVELSFSDFLKYI